MVPIPTIQPVKLADPAKMVRGAASNLAQIIGAGAVLYEGQKAEENRQKLMGAIRERAPYIEIRGNESLEQLAKGLDQVNRVNILYDEAQRTGATLPKAEQVYNYVFRSSPEAVEKMASSLQQVIDRSVQYQGEAEAAKVIGEEAIKAVRSSRLPSGLSAVRKSTRPARSRKSSLETWEPMRINWRP